MALTEEKVRTVCQELLATNADSLEFPGGSSRDSVRAIVAGKPVIVTRRADLKRAQLESGVLRVMNRAGAPVPHLIACKDNFLIQQHVEGRRLSECMSYADIGEVAGFLGSALESLQTVHDIGRQSPALQSIIALGVKQRWLETFVHTAVRLGSQLGLPAPELDAAALVKALQIESPSFIKWDARPGNAIVHASGKVIWIDWEHCGRRHPLDDVAWLLTDEYTPDLGVSEDQLIASLLPAFSDGYSEDRAHQYLAIYGTLHSCIRLAMIVRYQAKRGWWDYDYCLKMDKIGVTLELAQRVAQRASRWASRSALTRDLSPWFDSVVTRLRQLDNA